MGDERSHAILAAALSRGRPVSGHVYGREFVAAYAASGVTDTHEAIDRDIADDLLEAGIWLFLRGGTADDAVALAVEAIKAVTELGASHKRIAVCTDDRDADDLLMFGLDWVVREAVTARHDAGTGLGMGSLHGATRFGHGRRDRRPRRRPPRRPRAARRRSRAAVDLVWRRAGRRRTARSRRSSMRRCRIATAIPKAAYHTVKLPPGAQADARHAGPAGRRQRDPHRAARHRALP